MDRYQHSYNERAVLVLVYDTMELTVQNTNLLLGLICLGNTWLSTGLYGATIHKDTVSRQVFIRYTNKSPDLDSFVMHT